MAIEGGGNRDWLRPHNPDGEGKLLGSHRGNGEAFNIPNPQPGVHYMHGRRDRKYIQRKVNQGYRVITGDDPEAQPVGFDIDIPELDGVKAYGDTIAMKIPEDKWREIQAEKHRKAEYQRTGATDEYLDKGAKLAESTMSDDELYYKMKRHGLWNEE